MHLRLVPPFLIVLVLTACHGKAIDTGTEIVCFTNGDKPYDTLQAAVDDAATGDTIEVCDSVVQAGATITKDIWIVGQGPTKSKIILMGEDHAIEVDDAEVTIKGLTLASQGGTAVVTKNANVTLKNIAVEGAGYIGIDATESTLDVENATVRQGQSGCVHMNGGHLTMVDSEVSECNSYGVKLEHGAGADFTGNTIADAYYTGNSDYLFEADGAGLLTSDLAIVTSTDDQYVDNAVAGIQTEGSQITLSGVTIQNAYVGLLTLATDVHMDDVTIDGSAGYGGYFRTSTVDASNVTATTDSGSIGFLDAGGTMTLTNASISGWATGPVIAEALSDTTPATLTLDTATLDGGVFGVYLDGGSMTANAVDVSGVADDGSCVDADGNDTCNFGVYLSSADATWTGGSISGVGGFGVRVDDGRFDATSLGITGTPRSAVVGNGSAVLLDSVSISQAFEAGLDLTDSDAAIVGGSFTGGSGNTATSYVDETTGSTVVDTVYDTAVDIRASGGSVQLSGTTFSGGDHGIQGTDADLDVADATFTGYGSHVVDITGGSAKVERTSISDAGGPILSCAGGGTFDAEDVTVTRALDREVRGDETIDGVVVASSDDVFLDPAVMSSGCGFTASRVIVTDAAGVAFQLADGALDLEQIEVHGATTGDPDATAAVDLAFTATTPQLVVDRAKITGVGHGDGLRLTGVSGLDAGYVTLSNLQIGQDDGAGHAGVAGDGVYLADVTATLDGVTVTNAGGDGLSLVGGAHALSAVTVESAGDWGMTCDTTDVPTFLTCDAVSVTGTSGAALDCSGCP